VYFCVIFCVILFELLPTAFYFFAFSLLSLLFVCLFVVFHYICMHVYIFFFVFLLPQVGE